jgi:hypothetical protein
LAHNLATPCLGYEPKARVATPHLRMPFRLRVFLLASLLATFIISFFSMGQVRVFFVCSKYPIFKVSDENIPRFFHTYPISSFCEKHFYSI